MASKKDQPEQPNRIIRGRPWRSAPLLVLALMGFLGASALGQAASTEKKTSQAPRARKSANVNKQIKGLKRRIAALEARSGVPGPQGSQGPQGPAGSSSGAAGGALAGSYPNPTLNVSGGDNGPGACKNGKALTGLSALAVLTCSPGVYSDGNLNVAAGPTAFPALSLAATENTSMGSGALQNDAAGDQNSAFGEGALHANADGNRNSAFGENALSSNNGFGNSALGAGSLAANTTGDGNSAFGENTLSANTGGDFNSAFGQDTLSSNTTGFNNVALGNGVMGTNTIGANNVALGNAALSQNTGGDRNTAVGVQALQENDVNTLNTAVGFQALQENVGAENTAVGAGTLGAAASPTHTSGTDNSALGNNALAGDTSGSHNSAVGVNALFSNTTGTGNSALGQGALENNNSNFNTAVGQNAMNLNTTGNFNAALGFGALSSNTTGSHNSAFGEGALAANTGDSNVALGGALVNNTSGFNNTALGDTALHNNTTGSNNLALGRLAGFNHAPNDSNNIDIANMGVSGDSNTMRIGSPALNRTFISGVRGATTLGDGIPVQIDSQGQLGTIVSSRRFKQDIHAMASASNPIMKLRPVTFRYRSDPTAGLQYGLIAEQVAKVMPSLAVYGKDGLPETVQYQDLPVLLLNKVQEQQRTLRRQHHQNAALRAQNRSQQAQIDWLMRQARER